VVRDKTAGVPIANEWRLEIDCIQLKKLGIRIDDIHKLLTQVGIPILHTHDDHPRSFVLSVQSSDKPSIHVKSLRDQTRTWIPTIGLFANTTIAAVGSSQLQPGGDGSITNPTYVMSYVRGQGTSHAILSRALDALDIAYVHDHRTCAFHFQDTYASMRCIAERIDVYTQKRDEMDRMLHVYVGQARGSNLMGLFADDMVDPNRTFGNGCVELQNILGIEAAGSYMHIALDDILIRDCSVHLDPRHIGLIVNTFTMSGRLASIIPSEHNRNRNASGVTDINCKQSAKVTTKLAATNSNEPIDIMTSSYIGQTMSGGSESTSFFMYDNTSSRWKSKAEWTAFVDRTRRNPSAVAMQLSGLEIDNVAGGLGFSGGGGGRSNVYQAPSLSLLKNYADTDFTSIAEAPTQTASLFAVPLPVRTQVMDETEENSKKRRRVSSEQSTP
jgi:hypothetical protein